MATESGTATGFIDLYTKIITFATTALGADNWTMEHGYEHSDFTVDGTPTLGLQNTHDNKVILRGDGSGSDEIYIGMKTAYDSDLGKYTISLQGFNSFNNAELYDQQIYSSHVNHSFFWDQEMNYWFVGSSRRLIVVVKVGGVYQLMYMGFVLPYATPAEYPYPNFVGGCGIVWNTKYSDTGGGNDFFMNGRHGSGSLHGPDNYWLGTGNYDTGGSYPTREDKSIYFFPYSAGVDVPNMLGFHREALDGCHVLTHIEMVAQGDFGFRGILAAVDGVYHVTGFNQYSENVIDQAGTQYIVFQRVYRVGNSGFIAIKWE